MDRYAIIALGGALGALARYQLAALIRARVPAGFPWGTFAVNITGCLVMGIAATLLTERLVVHPNWRFLIPIGFIGGSHTNPTLGAQLTSAGARAVIADMRALKSTVVALRGW